MTRRATLRGAERTPLGDRGRCDVLICGASFAGLAAARALAGSGADVLVVDRYEIGERATSACAVPEPWIRALGLEAAVRQELPAMAFHTPHGSFRFRLPWAWSAFDYRTLCQALWAQCGGARFEVAKVEGRDGRVVRTDRGDLAADHIVDALGWRRTLGAGPHVQPPEATLSRGLEVHPHVAGGTDLDVYIDRSLVRYGYAWRVPAGGEQRVGAGSYEPRHSVRPGTVEAAARLAVPPERFQGNYFPHRLRPAVEDGILFAGDSAGHCLPATGEGIRTALHFGHRAGRELRAVLAGERAAASAHRRYAAFSAAHRPAFEAAYGLQWVIPRLPPRVLTGVLRFLSRPRVCRPLASAYLRLAQPPVSTRRSGAGWFLSSPPTSVAPSAANSASPPSKRSTPVAAGPPATRSART